MDNRQHSLTLVTIYGQQIYIAPVSEHVRTYVVQVREAFLFARDNDYKLQYASLPVVDLSCMDLSGLDLQHADLSAANLSQCSMQNCDLYKAQLCGTKF